MPRTIWMMILGRNGVALIIVAKGISSLRHECVTWHHYQVHVEIASHGGCGGFPLACVFCFQRLGEVLGFFVTVLDDWMA